jgi:hypothetical protein
MRAQLEVCKCQWHRYPDLRRAVNQLLSIKGIKEVFRVDYIPSVRPTLRFYDVHDEDNIIEEHHVDYWKPEPLIDYVKQRICTS